MRRVLLRGATRQYSKMEYETKPFVEEISQEIQMDRETLSRYIEKDPEIRTLLKSLPKPVDTFQPPEVEERGESMRNPVGLGEPVIPGETWVLEQNRWYKSKDMIGKVGGRVTDGLRRGRDIRIAYNRVLKEEGIEKQEGVPDMLLLMRVEDDPSQLPKVNPNRETPAITRRRIEQKRLSIIRQRSLKFHHYIQEERKQREALEQEEMQRQKAIRMEIKAKEMGVRENYQKAWNEYRTQLRNRYKQQQMISRQIQERIEKIAKKEWLQALNEEMKEVPEEHIPHGLYYMKNRRYLTYQNQTYFP